ncbi:MAG: M23 family metallopeptidase [Proteiniphilum sp.]|nr:M23 family metallopeptidase [Proteiniphilum sp.]
MSMVCFNSFAQKYSNPVDVPIALSGGFGELRANHFHSGIDYKTLQVINKPIYSIADGYVSRISVSPSGYGLALYVTHEDTGHTSVYAHLNSFADNIAAYVRKQQYEKETFRIELYPEKDMFPVTKGQQIALSGNTGSSGGPHLHFEVRDAITQDPLDPLDFFKHTVLDTQKPDLRRISFYPQLGKGVINGSNEPIRINIAKNNQGAPLAVGQTIRAWGKIGVGVEAYDKMNGQHNIYGIKHVRLFVDEKKHFSQTIGRYSFSNTSMLNALIDYEDWRKRRTFLMKSFVLPGNKLNFYDAVDNGYININEERNYRMRYELEDYHGNVLTYSFVIEGVKQDIAVPEDKGYYMSYIFRNYFVDSDFVLDIPRDNLYEDVFYYHNKISSDEYLSDIYKINDKPVPLHNSAKMWIKLKVDTLANKKQYGIVDVTGRMSWVGVIYKNGGVETSIGELGRQYAISYDNVLPVITPVNAASWKSNRKIQVRLSDNLSGIAHFRGTINGEYVLFKHDMKSPVYTYTFDEVVAKQSGTLHFEFVVTDGAGNVARYEYDI